MIDLPITASADSRDDHPRDRWRRNFTFFLERLDGLRQLIERKSEEGQKERAADQKFLYALVKDHTRCDASRISIATTTAQEGRACERRIANDQKRPPNRQRDRHDSDRLNTD